MTRSTKWPTFIASTLLAGCMLMTGVAEAQSRRNRPSNPPFQPPRTAPELSVAAAPSAGLLLVGGLMILAGRRRRNVA